ncbi:lipoprotein [Polaromonas naphthalenivorans]|uniref:Lipoprotein n=1 Tax=Polaromonas naphthalenivorans (strain CJ2) TaxID=365044 RepID=A1VV37_POLNA|nr:lipoprotein [Polaromonas naphthalenivorans]ABM39515.1 lipoprotein [Polaromonas naphthalenivorans CJ2]
MRQHLLSLFVTAALATIALPGCGTYNGKQEIKQSLGETRQHIDAMATASNSRARDMGINKFNGQDVGAPWIAGKSIPLSKEVSVPSQLRKNVRTTVLSSECANAVTLRVVANCITDATGLPVRVKADANLPIASFVPRASAGAGPAPAPATRPGEAGNSGANTTRVFTPEAADISLTRLLDTISAVYSVSYRLTNDSALEFYRLDTRTFRIKSLAQKLTAKTTQSTGFDNNSITTFEIKEADAIDAIGKTITAMGTMAGSINVSHETKAVTVTDTPEVLDSIARYLEEENKRLTRRVTLVVDQFYVSDKDNREFSLDWNLVYGALNVSSASRAPTTLAPDTAGAFGAVANTGRFAGSGLLVKALSEQGLMVQQRSFPLSTQNGSPVSIGLPTIFDYVSEVTLTQTNAGAVNSQTAPSVKQKEEKIGTYLTITPEAQDDGQVIISANFQDRTGVLTPYTVQAGGNSSTIQQRNIDEVSNIVRTVVRVGVPTVIGGLSETVDNSKDRRLVDGAPILLGGSDSLKKNRRSMILVVTAVAEDGV